jgi:CheY-like chemotaxis protein
MAHKLLLIEDDPTLLSLLSTLLGMDGYDISVVVNDESVENILYTVQQTAPDLVLMDVHLRCLNGLDVLQAVRQQFGPTPYIVMSSGTYLSQQCLEAGADGFIMKPYMPDDLIKLIRQLLARS